MSATKYAIAEWMIREIEARGFLCQEDAAQWIGDKFGTEWIYENENGNPTATTCFGRLNACTTTHDGGFEVRWERFGMDGGTSTAS